jgi:hypothetical protein
MFSSGWDPDAGRRRTRTSGFRYGRPRRAPAWRPYAAVVALVLLFPIATGAQQAWNQPWFPGVESATKTPDPCLAVGPAALQRLELPGTGLSNAGLGIGRGVDQTCTFRSGSAAMAVRYRVANAFFGSSRRKAAKVAAEQMTTTGTQAVPGLFDEARISAGAGGTAHLVARRANVVVEISYQGIGGPDLAPAIIDVARGALATVDVH